MIANGWTYEQLEMAMIRTSVRYGDNMQFANHPEFSNIKRTRCTNLRIKPINSCRRADGSYPKGSLVNPCDTKFGRRSCGAACWHAYGYFIRTLMDINPNGKIGTREAVYLGKDGFERTFPKTGRSLRGGMFGEEYRHCCDCHEYDLTEF